MDDIQAQLSKFAIPIAIVFIYSIVCWWIIFTKAGKPGWAILIPFYNYVVMCQIAGKPGWYWLLWLIPCVDVIFIVLYLFELAKSFGKDVVFAILFLVILGPIGLGILAFSAQYEGPGGRRKGLRSQRFEDDDDDRPRPRRRDEDDDDEDDRPLRRR